MKEAIEDHELAHECKKNPPNLNDNFKGNSYHGYKELAKRKKIKLSRWIPN